MPGWFQSEKRIELYKDVNETHRLCEENKTFAPSASWIASAMKKAMEEIALKSPYRAGNIVTSYFILMFYLTLVVTHQLPYDALITAEECYDPTSCSEDDDTVTEVIDGIEVTLLRDWSKPPVRDRCPCQVAGGRCKCNEGAKPKGYCMSLSWDKVNNINR